jgi:hypothetical protein
MSQETEYLPWRTGINRLSYVIEMLESTSAFGNFQNYLIDLVKPLYNKLGWEEKESDSWLQRFVLRNKIYHFNYFVILMLFKTTTNNCFIFRMQQRCA